MSSNMMRKDYILDRWVVIAAQRKRRPTDFAKPKEQRASSTCPFCPGNEHVTPPASLVYLENEGRIVSEKDSNGFRHKGWLVRCVPNLYPAFAPPGEGEAKIENSGWFKAAEALGHHEVIIESPRHDEHPGAARVSQLVHVIHAYQDRLRAFESKKYVRHILIFRNHGADAGASLSHAHTQIVAMPTIPRTVGEELERSREYFDKNGGCIFCGIIEKEAKSPRFIWENEGFIVFAPWASVHPFEFWVFPKRHQSTILDMTESEVTGLARTLRGCFGGLKSLIADPSYNFGFHMVPDSRYHWHIEVYPRLAIWAGLEKSSGMFINIESPEEAALSLREAIKKEEATMESE